MILLKKYYIDEDPTGGPGKDQKPPAPPKDYKGIAPQVRQDWNSFLDYLDKKGVGGKADLDKRDQTLGLNYLNQYRKENPKTSITPEIIPQIQYDQYLLRKGDSYPGLSSEQLKYVRTGLNPAYMARPVSDVDGWLGSATTKQYYPTARRGTNKGDSYDFGVNLEDYVNSLQNPELANKYKVGVQPVQPAASTPVAKPVAATPAGHGPPDMPASGDTTGNGEVLAAAPAISTPVSPTTPPTGGLPATYASHDTALKRAQALGSIPGNDFVKGRADTLIHAGYVPGTDTKSFKDSSISAAKPLGIDPAMFYASAAEEGMTGLVPDKKGQVNTGNESHVDLNGKYPVDGFTNFGLDHFHDQFKELVKRGYLPKNFDYQKATIKNPENGETVNSGNFKSVEDATKAKAAFIRMEKDNLEDWSKINQVQLSPAANQFFTFVAYNGGPGTAHKMINYYKANGLLEGDKFLQKAPPKEVDKGDSYGKVLPRWKMAQLLKSEKIFE